MPTQHQLFSRIGNRAGGLFSNPRTQMTPLPPMEGVFQQQKSDLFPKEKAYLQKFLTVEPYFDSRGMLSLSAARPQSEFLNFLYGLKPKEEVRGAATGKVATSRKTEGAGAMITPIIPRQTTAEAVQGQVVAPPIYGPPANLVIDESSRYGQGIPTLIENTAIYQSYLNQQINEYRYQTQLYQSENHWHQAAAAITGGEKENIMLVKTIREKAAAQKNLGGTGASTIAMSTAAEKETFPELVSSENGASEKAVVPMFPLNQWEPLARLSEPGITSASETAGDWSEICSFLRQNIAETFTELLQNMIPETEGR
ncbi:MAG: hypothetical protein HFI72_05770 [Peptococcaceae bacterium]|nr:hypothetical protein [Peptococcaceae bacterium]